MFEVMGARATAAGAGRDRYGRNLRTHTLHDPLDDESRDVGNGVLDGEPPKPSFCS
jgi:hypothetical protein